jgi:hypothetical protein
MNTFDLQREKNMKQQNKKLRKKRLQESQGQEGLPLPKETRTPLSLLQQDLLPGTAEMENFKSQPRWRSDIMRSRHRRS